MPRIMMVATKYYQVLFNQHIRYGDRKIKNTFIKFKETTKRNGNKELSRHELANDTARVRFFRLSIEHP